MNSVSSALSSTFSKFMCFSVTHRLPIIHISLKQRSKLLQTPSQPLERFHLGSENYSHAFPTHISIMHSRHLCYLIIGAACVAMVAHCVTSKKQKIIAKCRSRVSSLSPIDTAFVGKQRKAKISSLFITQLNRLPNAHGAYRVLLPARLRSMFKPLSRHSTLLMTTDGRVYVYVSQ